MTDDIRDPEVERMLGRLSGAYPDTNVAFQAVQGRVRQVKRRRAFVASTAACAMLFGVAAVAAQGGGRSQTVSPAAPIDSSVVATDSSAAPSTDVATSLPDTSAVTTVVDSSVVETSAPDTSTPGSGSDATPTSASTSTDGPTTSEGGTASSGPSTSATLPQGERTWSSDGGSVTVSNDNGTLRLLDASPAAGFEATRLDASSNRIRVEFSDGNTTWRIEIRTDGGKARAEITRHG